MHEWRWGDHIHIKCSGVASAPSDLHTTPHINSFHGADRLDKYIFWFGGREPGVLGRPSGEHALEPLWQRGGRREALRCIQICEGVTLQPAGYWLTYSFSTLNVIIQRSQTSRRHADSDNQEFHLLLIPPGSRWSRKCKILRDTANHPRLVPVSWLSLNCCWMFERSERKHLGVLMMLERWDVFSTLTRWWFMLLLCWKSLFLSGWGW